MSAPGDSSVRPELVEGRDLADWIRVSAASGERYLFGLAGPPGCGKSTLTAHLAEVLGATIVPMDGFHLPNTVLDARGLRGVKGAPHTFDAEGFVDAVGVLRFAATDVLLPDFDRTIDEPRPDQIRVARDQRVVIVEGNYLLLDTDPWARLTGLFDAIAYLDVDQEVRVGRLIDRHVEFGKTRDDARAFVVNSDEPNARIVAASRSRADLLVTGIEARR